MISLKKIVCIVITFALTATLFACTKKEEKPTEISAQANAESTAETAIVPASVEFSVENFEELQSVISGVETDTEVESYLYVCSYPTVNRQEEKTKPVFVVPEGLTENQQIHWPNIPVIGIEPFQVAACAEMGKNPKFNGAKIIKDQYLQLGEINGEPCVRVHFDTDKGDFVAVMNEACEIIWVWTEGEEYTYDEATGLFTTVAGVITVPEATYTQNPTTGEWTVTPGTSVAVVNGTV